MKDIRESILKNGRVLFTEKGYADTSIQDVLEACNISRGSFYRFFKAKEDLFFDINCQCHDEFMEQIATLSAAVKDPRELLEMAAYLLLDFFVTNDNIVRKMAGLTSGAVEVQRRRFSVWVFATYGRMFMKVYGPELHDYIFDVLQYQRTLNSGYSRIFFSNNTFGATISDVAKREFQLIDNYVQYMLKTRPAPLTPPEMGRVLYPELKDESFCDSPYTSLEYIDRKMSVAIEDEVRREDMKASIALLVEELGREEPRYYLINALLNYLKSEECLHEYALQIQKAVNHSRFSGQK